MPTLGGQLEGLDRTDIGTCRRGNGRTPAHRRGGRIELQIVKTWATMDSRLPVDVEEEKDYKAWKSGLTISDHQKR